jgi:hypothetical protein
MCFTDDARAAVAAACTVLHVTLTVAPVAFSTFSRQPSVILSPEPGFVAPVRREAAPQRQLGGAPGTLENLSTCTHADRQTDR